MKNNQVIVQTAWGIDTWTIDASLVALAKPIASQLGVSLVEFLTRVSNNEFCGGPPEGVDSDDVLAPKGFRISLPADSQLVKFVRRAARVAGKTIDDLAWEALSSHAACIEEGMIFDSDGNCLLDHRDILDPWRKRQFRDSGHDAGEEKWTEESDRGLTEGDE